METANTWEYKVGINANIANFFVFVKMSNMKKKNNWENESSLRSWI